MLLCGFLSRDVPSRILKYCLMTLFLFEFDATDLEKAYLSLVNWGGNFSFKF